MVTVRYKEQRIYAQCYPARDMPGHFIPIAMVRGPLVSADDPVTILSGFRCRTLDEAENVATKEAKKWIDEHQH
jgi:hypothetical protein